MGYALLAQARVFIFAAALCGVCEPRFASAQDAQPYCDPMVGLLSHDFSPTRLSDISAAAEAARAKAETSPFANACQDPALFKDRPPTGLFRRSVPLSDSRGNSSAEFLKGIGHAVLESMSEEELKLSVMEDCLGGKLAASAPACRNVRGKIDNEILPMVKTARMNLALSQTVAQIKTATFRKASYVPNETLNALGTQKEIDWTPLEPDELKNANLILQEYVTESQAEADREVAAGAILKKDVARFVNDSVLSSRYTQGLAYVETLSHFPMLQYLKSAKPSDTEIMQAVTTMRQHLKRDRAYAEKALGKASETSSYGSYRGVRYKNGPLKELNPDALGLLDFTSHVESALQAKPEFCGLAASLQYTKENRSLGNGLAIGIPLVVVSLALPFAGQAIAGSVIGFASGAGFAVQSKFDRNEAANRFISKLEATSADEYNKLDRADRDFKISLALGPLAGVAGPAVRTATVSLRATKFGAKLAMRARK